MKFGALLAWLLSAIPCAWPGLAERCSGISVAALAALPWLAYAGLPRAEFQGSTRRAARAGDGPPRDKQPGSASAALEASSSALVPAALALPPVALGAWFDVAGGRPLREVLATILGSLAFALLFAFAARRAVLSSRRQVVYALIWLSFVAGAPLARAALELGGAPRFGQVPRWLHVAADASPLAWLSGRVVPRVDAGIPWLAIVAALVIAVIACAPERSSNPQEMR